jgi:type VI protein secretion system component Hcp
MKSFIISVLLLFSCSVHAQLKFFIDIPKVDGERAPVTSRKSLTKAPKEKCTHIHSFSFTSSKSIFINPSLEVQRNGKTENFQPLEVIFPLDKSVTEWHERIFRGTTMPTLDLFIDKTFSNSVSELVHIKLVNVKVKELSFSQALSFPDYRVTLNYDRIIYASSKLSIDGTVNSVTQTCFDVKTGAICTETL